MNAYKEYMDRISLDEEQHGRLMEAVLAAEAAEAEKSGQPEAETPTKIRRFPLKTLGWIASAAAVIVLFVAVIPQNKKSASLSVTEAAAHEQVQADSLAPNAMQEQPLPAENAATVGCELTAASDFSIVSHVTSANAGKASADGEQYMATYTYTVTLSLENSENDAAETVKIQIYEILQQMEDRLAVPATKTVETRYAEVTADNGGRAEESSTAARSIGSVSFIMGGESYDYDAQTGLLRSDGREYRLLEDEKNELNSLLESILAEP